MSAQIIEEYCKSTGYIPQRYISMVKSYKKTNDFEEKLIASSIKLGATREQAIIILDKSRNLIKQQIIKSTERDYLEIKKEEPSYTKKEYCKLHDSNATEMPGVCYPTRVDTYKDFQAHKRIQSFIGTIYAGLEKIPIVVREVTFLLKPPEI